MADLTPWSWKKTFPPSSGHTVLISSFDIPRSSLPLSTPRLLTVLQEKAEKTEYLRSTCNTSLFYSGSLKTWLSPCGLGHSHLGESFVLQPGFHLWRWGGQVQSNCSAILALCGASVTTNMLIVSNAPSNVTLNVTSEGRMHFLIREAMCHWIYRQILLRPGTPHRLQNVLRNVSFFITGVPNKPPLLGFLNHL